MTQKQQASEHDKIGDLEINRIYCMDCLDLLKRLPNSSVDLVITDPPYNTGLVPSKNKRGKLCNFFNDRLDDWSYEKLIKDTALELYRVLKKDRACLVFIDFRNVDKLKNWFVWAGFNFKQILIWDKVVHGLNYQNFSYTYEMILYFTKGKFYHKRIRLKKDIISVMRVNLNNEINHETVKPVELIRLLIEECSDENDLVLDPFIGSGTTAVACVQTSRNFIGCEISPEYCELANKRLKQENINKWLEDGIHSSRLD